MKKLIIAKLNAGIYALTNMYFICNVHTLSEDHIVFIYTYTHLFWTVYV